MPTYYAIVPHPAEPLALLLPTPGGWTLPSWERAGYLSWVHEANRALQEQLGLQVTTLRVAADPRHRAARGGYILLAMEVHSPRWAPPTGSRWVGRAALAGLELAVPEHRVFLEEWLDQVEERAAPPLRVPWYQRGWWKAATAWIADQRARLGLQAAGPIQQLRSSQRSALLRVPTGEGDLYFKAVPAMFAQEIGLTQLLAAQYPESMPRVLAADLERRWFLMADVGGTSFEDIPDVALWEQALRLYAQIQIEQATHGDRLLALGCPDRRLPTLAAEMDALFEDRTALLVGKEYWGLSEAEIGRLQALAPRLKGMCAELASYHVPYSLEHGDLWCQQIMLSGGRCVFIDWSDASLAHPFFSLSFFYAADDFFFQSIAAGQRLAAIPRLRERLRDAYLEPWTAYEPPGRLRQAFELAHRLSALHTALLYHRIILPQMEFRWENENMLTYHLRNLLGRMQ